MYHILFCHCPLLLFFTFLLSVHMLWEQLLRDQQNTLMTMLFANSSGRRIYLREKTRNVIVRATPEFLWWSSLGSESNDYITFSCIWFTVTQLPTFNLLLFTFLLFLLSQIRYGEIYLVIPWLNHIVDYAHILHFLLTNFPTTIGPRTIKVVTLNNRRYYFKLNSTSIEMSSSNWFLYRKDKYLFFTWIFAVEKIRIPFWLRLNYLVVHNFQIFVYMNKTICLGTNW